MFKKILVVGLVAGAAAYFLRDKIVEGFTFLEGKFLGWAAEDPTEDETPTFRGTAPVPDLTDSYPVGKRGQDA